MAFAQTVSMRPKRSTASSTTRVQSSSEATSASTPSAGTPSASSSETVSSRPSAPRAAATTVAPRAAASRTIARPRPAEAPVTRTTWSLSGFLVTVQVFPGCGRPNAVPFHVDAWLDRPPRAPPAPPRGAPPVRAEAAARDGPLTRQGHAGVQGLRHRHGPAGRACGAPDDDADARERAHLLARREASPAPPGARRGGDARRAPRRAPQAHLHLPRGARARARRHLLVPPPHRSLAER